MTSDSGPSDSSSSLKAEAEPGSQTIILHILSPSLDAPSRLTLDDLPLTTSVRKLKERLSQQIPSHPQPEMQRLIYRGKPLINNDETLANILEYSDSQVHSIHLVLPPTTNIAPAPSHASDTTSSQPTGPTQPNSLRGQLPLQDYLQQTTGLRFRGPQAGPNGQPPLAQGPAQFPPPQSLIDQVAAIREQAARFSPGLSQDGPFQPPGNPVPASVTNHPTQPLATSFTTVQTFHIPLANGNQQPHDSPASPLGDSGLNTSTTPFPATNSHLHNSGLGASSPNILRQRASSPAITSSSGPFSSAVASPHPMQRTSSHPSTRSTASEITSASSSSGSRRQRISTSYQQVVAMENLLRRGGVPPMDEIIQVRTQILQLQDEQYVNPSIPRDGLTEHLLARVSGIYSRADQTRLLRHRVHTLQQSATTGTSPTAASTQTSVYLLSSPSGYNAVLVPPGAVPPLPQGSAARSQEQATELVGAQPLPQGANQPNPQALANRMLQQAVQQRRQGQFLSPAFLARNIRRLWLFIRLYFFCYLLSEDGTWFRMFLVTFAVVTAALSETNVPQRFQRLVFDPMQRHLENLIPLEAQPNRRRPAAPTAVEAEAARMRAALNRNGQPLEASEALAPPPAGQADVADQEEPRGFGHNLRRAERSIALFVASLVPGIGERHVAARNAVEAAREAERRAREEEANREGQGGEPQRPQNNESGSPPDDAQQNEQQQAQAMQA